MGFEVFAKNSNNLFTPPNPNGKGFAIFGDPEEEKRKQEALRPLLPPGPPLVKNTLPGFQDPLFNKAVEMPAPEKPLWKKVDEAIFENPLARVFDSFQEKGASALTFGLTDKLAPLPREKKNDLAEKIGGGVGTFAGSLLPIGGAYKLTGGLAGKLLPNAPKAVDRLVRGGLAGTAYGTVDQTIDALADTKNDGEQTLGQRAKNVALDAALFGVGDVALHGLAKGAKKVADDIGFTNWLRSRFGKSVEVLPPDPLGLPAPKSNIAGLLPNRPIAGLLPEPRKPDFIAGFSERVIPRRFTPKTPESPYNFQRLSGESPTQYRLVNPAERKLQELYNVAEQRGLSVGREYEDLENLLGQLSDYAGMSLDDLIRESTKQIRITEIAPGVRQGITPQTFLEAAKQVAQRNRLAQAAGVMDRPKIGRGPTVQVPFVEQPAKPLLPELPKPIKKTPTLEDLKAPLKPLEEKHIGKKEIAASIEPLKASASEQGYNFSNWKDISGFKGQMTDVYRILKDASGEDFAKVKKNLLDPFDAAKKANIEYQEKLLNDLKTNVVDKLGIKKGSKESALVQMYGEKEITLDELKKRAPDKWKDIVKAEQWFRQTYDKILDDVNKVRAQIYPNQPDKLVPKRKDYFRHFQEFGQLSGLKNLFDTPSSIDPSLVRVSEFTKPNSKFAGFMQKRGLGPFKRDAVGGMLEYAPAASYSIHIDPQIGKFKELSKSIEGATEESKHLNNLLTFMGRYEQDLAGKTNMADRFIQEVIPGGRTTMAALQWLNNRVKANTILGNVGSTLAQFANIPNGIAFAKQYAVKGAGLAMKAAIKPSEAMQQSGFLKERFAGKMYREFDTKIIEQPRRFAEWLMETADRVGTYFVWNSAYAKGLAEGVANPVKYADDATRSLIAGRGIGEVPLLQKSKLFQLIAPFQLEVANLWRVQKDFVKAKDFGALATLYTSAWLFNRGMEEIRGSGVMFDPIQAFREAMEEDLTPLQRAGRVAGEVLSNLPLGQTLAAAYPEYGKEMWGVELPTRKQLFGDNDPTRFGEGLAVVKGAQDPLYKLLLPFGGNQLKKSLEGASALKDGGAYQNNFATDPFAFGNYAENKLKYPINTDGLLKQAQLLTLGPNATPEAREYYKEERRPLSEKQTRDYETVTKKQQFYDDLMRVRKLQSIENKIRDVVKDQELSEAKKREEVQKLLQKLKEAKDKMK